MVQKPVTSSTHLQCNKEAFSIETGYHPVKSKFFPCLISCFSVMELVSNCKLLAGLDRLTFLTYTKYYRVPSIIYEDFTSGVRNTATNAYISSDRMS